MDTEYDFIIIGSGFGGSVSAMRLAQKDYSVVILEMGKEYRNTDFPKSNWNIRKFLWAPKFLCHGIQSITLLKKLMVLHGVGVGGGSLVYANTLMQPDKQIFSDPHWPSSVDWSLELGAHFAEARRMLGVVTNPFLCENESALREVGNRLGVEETFHSTEVGIYFGPEPQMRRREAVPDPYFNGEGPERVPCHGCGSCMIGCPTGAKNTLDKNYLWFARKWGARIVPETKANRIRPIDGGYLVETESSTSLLRSKGQTFRGRRVILAAGALGTVELLLKNRDQHKTLPKISPALGFEVRTNGESLLGATATHGNSDYSRGIAIGAAIHPDSRTKIEGVRYPAGSGLLRWLAVPLTGPGSALTRPLKLLTGLAFKSKDLLRLLLVKDWAKQTVILLAMQSNESKMRLRLSRSLFPPFARKLSGEAKDMPSYLPEAQMACELLAERMDGVAQNVASEVLLQTTATAHILGGAVLAEDQSKGVISVDHEVFGYPGLFVCDGSVIPTNLAVNPSLTITALAERFASRFPHKRLPKG